MFLLDWCQQVYLCAKHLSVQYKFNGMVPFLPIQEFIEGLFGEDIFELLVRLRHYIFEAHGSGPSCGFCKLLGYHLSDLELFQVFANEAYEKSVALIQIVWIWACKAWWQSGLVGFCPAFG